MVANGQPVGRCTLRVGYNDLVEYAGNIGYEVEEEHRGHHYALISCRLLLRLARRHRMEEVLITCREDNFASRRTCEQLGATPAGRVDVPVNHEMYRADSDAPLLQYRYRLGLELRPITEQELVEVGKLYECVTADQLAGENYSGWDTEYPRSGLHASCLHRAGCMVCSSSRPDSWWHRQRMTTALTAAISRSAGAERSSRISFCVSIRWQSIPIGRAWDWAGA